jgi:hypothetical protein
MKKKHYILIALYCFVGAIIINILLFVGFFRPNIWVSEDPYNTTDGYGFTYISGWKNGKKVLKGGFTWQPVTHDSMLKVEIDKAVHYLNNYK